MIACVEIDRAAPLFMAKPNPAACPTRQLRGRVPAAGRPRTAFSHRKTS